MRALKTIILILLALLCITIATLLTIDGNLSRLIGRTAFDKGERLFPYSKEEINEINWMRIKHGNDKAEFRRQPNGVWWASSPWNDRVDPRAAAAILQFTHSASIVDALPLNNTVKASIKEFGVQTNPTEITLKHVDKNESGTTMARYTLGSKAPWIVDDFENKTSNDTTYTKTDYYGRDNRILVLTGNITPLFKEGIRQLRDHRPLLFHPELPARISIKNKNEEIQLSRKTPQSPWVITYPLELESDPQMVNVLLGALQKLTATRVHNPEETAIPELSENDTVSVSLSNFEIDQDQQKLIVGNPVVLTMFPTSDSSANNLVKAVVSDRPAVFDLPYKAPKAEKGQQPAYASYQNLPLTLNLLRSKNITSLHKAPIIGIFISSTKHNFPITFRYNPPNKDSGTPPSWTFSAEGNPPAPVDENNLAQLIRAIKEGRVDGFASDSPTDLKIYGLDRPIYSVMITAKDDQNASEIKSSFLNFGKGADRSWYVQEDHKPTIYNISSEFVALFNMDELHWRAKKIFKFNRFDLKKMTVENVGSQPALELNYDSLDDTWTAKQGEKDVTVDINPNRANTYLRELEKIEIFQWLPYDDHRAWKAIQQPSFRLILDLEGYSKTANFLSDQKNHTDQKEKHRIMLEFAPIDKNNPKTYYYGKMEGCAEFFLIDDYTMKVLQSSLYEQQ